MTRQQKRRRFSTWLADLFQSRNEPVSQRRILVEPLESRQLMAGDAFMALLGSAHRSDVDENVFFGDSASQSSTAGSQLSGEGELVGEGEDTNDLVAFAKALTDSGTRFFGAAWCPFCTEQKELFEDGYKYLPFIEVTNPDRTPNQVAIDEGITEYPTWEFPDGTRITGPQSLATLSQRSGVAIPQSSTPSFAELPDVSVAIGSPLHIPIDAYDPNGNPLTITVTSSNSSVVTADLLTGNRSLRLNTAGFGDMVFELFEDRAPTPTGRVIELAEDGFYDGITFHRVINSFVIQGGDPTGTGSGGSTLGDFDDQFHLELQHNRTGALSYAKSTDDTNDSQFFITEGPQRFLDFNHSVFGQLVEGEAVREAISGTSTNASDRPINAVTIEDATIFTDTENGMIVLRPTGNSTGSATITVTVADNEGNSTSQTFNASVIQDSANGAPFLNPIAEVQTSVNTPVNVNLTSQDKEGDTVIYSVQPVGTQTFGLSVDSGTGVVTVTPPTDFTGSLQFLASVRQSTTATTSSQDDNQLVTVQVIQSVPTSIDLDAASDTGISDSDNITNAQSLTFSIAGTNTGSLVELRSGGVVVGSATATGSTTQVTVSDVSSLGEGAVAFTATQTTGGQTSGESPSITVTLDRTDPAAIAAGIIPTNTIVGRELSIDIDQPEEGQGLTYGLASAPAGMSIGPSNGLVQWTPVAGQLGQQSLTMTLTDAAGNVTSQDFSITVIEDPEVRILLNAVDLNGQPITTIAAGETFRVQVTVEDLRPGASATGVFGAYIDLLFDSNIIEPVGADPINHVSPYNNGAVGTLSTGLIDELGAFSSTNNPLGNELRVLAEITFLAKSPGNAGLALESADDAGNDVLLYDQSQAVDVSRVEFGSSTFAVGADFQLVDDSFNFDEDATVQSLNVFSNDTGAGVAGLTISAVGTPSSGGQVSIASDGRTINYTPAANFNGAEVFTYTAENSSGIEATATVTVQLTAVNDPPIALNDSFNVARNSSNNILEVLANDSSGVDDANQETLSIASVGTGSAGGLLEIGSSGQHIRYTPVSGFQGTETFSYTLSDGRGGSANATVSVSVAVDNAPPIAQNDSFTVEEDAAQASFDVLANDSTEDAGETISISDVGNSANGSFFEVDSSGQSVLYRPAANFSGTEILTYTIRDSRGATAQASVTFNVTSVNDAPIANNDVLTVISGQATSVLDVLANDTTNDAGEVLQIESVTQPPSGSGTLAIASDNRSLIYTPPASDFEGNFSFSYTINDGNGLQDSASVTVTVADFIPRDFTGRLEFGGGSGFDILGTIHGTKLTLTGTDITGATVSETARVAADGTYRFSAMAPGDYSLSRDALPFLHDTAQTINFNSAEAATESVNDLLVSGSLQAQFFDIRDFLGSSLTNSIAIAINDSDGTAWIASNGEWSDLTSVDATISGDDSLNLSAVNSDAAALANTLAISDASTRVYEAGRQSQYRLLRIQGSPASAGLTEATAGAGEGEAASTAPQSSGNTASSTNGLNAEGEATPLIETATTPATSTPTITGVRRGLTTAASEPSNVDESRLSPSAILQRLLGSSRSDTQVLSSEAVDEAMTSVLPTLEVSLSDNLQNALTADTNTSIEIQDQLISRF